MPWCFLPVASPDAILLDPTCFYSDLSWREQVQLSWSHDDCIHSHMSLQSGKKLIASSKLRSKIRYAVSVTFATLCKISEKYFLLLWSLTTAHWTKPMGFQQSVFDIKCLCICKRKLVMGNISLGTNTHLNLWSHLWFWLNSCIRSKGSNKFTTLSIREDSWMVAPSWFTVHVFLSTSQHTHTFCYRFWIWKSFQKGNNDPF